MRRSSDSDALRDVLHAAFGTPAPVRPLDELGFLASPGSPDAPGAGVFAALEPAVRERPTLLGGPTPYQPACPAPTAAALGELDRVARAHRVDQVLVPAVRRGDDTRALRAAGFVPVAGDPECVVRLTGEVDHLLRGRVGERRLGELRRRHRELGRELGWECVPLAGLAGSPRARDAFVELHRRQAERDGVGHRPHPYRAEALDALARGPLADRAELLVRRHGDAVRQVALTVAAHNGRGVYHLTQALAEDDPAVRGGLCRATWYGFLLRARRAGLEWVHLGRGPAAWGRDLGADLFVPVDHWLRAPGLGPAPEPAGEVAASRFASPAVAAVPVPGPARFRHRPRFDTVDLSSNTNPFLGPGGSYPHLDTAELAGTYLSALAQLPGHDGLDALDGDHLLFTSGAVDAVALLLTALTSPGDRVCVTPPTFELYGHFARVLHLPVVEVPLRGDDLTELDTAGVLAAGPRVTVLCDPNNPVGTRLAPEQVHDLITRSPGLVVIDEAYVEFSDHPSYAPLVTRHDNLVVLRTLSKAWGLAGARCGIALAQPGLVDALRRVQVPFGFTEAAQHAVRERLTDRHRVLASLRLIRSERERLATTLAEHPAVRRVFPSQTNFLLVDFHRQEQVTLRLRNAGIMVADTGHLVPGTCRISVSTPPANDALLAALGTGG